MTEPAAAGLVLDFWFSETPAQLRFAVDPAFDRRLVARFGTLHAALAGGVPSAWSARPRPLLAAVIVLDQFSRNLFRGQPQAFAQDVAARALTIRALDGGNDAALNTVQRQFLYMPLMHAENDADQKRAVALFAALGEMQSLDFARRHAAVIERFGRFPARNAILGRASTAAETAFLRDHPSGF